MNNINLIQGSNLISISKPEGTYENYISGFITPGVYSAEDLGNLAISQGINVNRISWYNWQQKAWTTCTQLPMGWVNNFNIGSNQKTIEIYVNGTGGSLQVSIETAPVSSQQIFKYGDVDGDGQVTSYDAALVMQYLSGEITFTDIQKKAADVNGDGQVTSYDAALIGQYINGTINKFPAEVNSNVTSPAGVNLINPVSVSKKLFKYGDVDGDGQVTQFDAALVMQHVAGLSQLTPQQLIVADVDGDGQVTLVDASLITRYAIGEISRFPAEKKEINRTKRKNMSRLLPKSKGQIKKMKQNSSTRRSSLMKQMKRFIS